MLIDIVGHFEKSLLFVLRNEQMDIEKKMTQWTEIKYMSNLCRLRLSMSLIGQPL